MRKRYDLVGQRFGRLVVVSQTKSPKGFPLWECVCDCGGKTTARTANLLNGQKKSCGCLKREAMQIALAARTNKTNMARDTKPKSLPKGVRPSGRRWLARIQTNGRNIYLGTFDTMAEAVTARKEAEEKYFDKKE